MGIECLLNSMDREKGIGIEMFVIAITVSKHEVFSSHSYVCTSKIVLIYSLRYIRYIVLSV